MLPNDILQIIFTYIDIKKINLLSKYWNVRAPVIAENQYHYYNNHILKNLDDQIENLNNVKILHEKYHVGESKDIGIKTHKIFLNDYGSIGYLLKRSQLKKLYQYNLMTSKFKKNEFCRSVLKDKKCVIVYILYITLLFCMILLLIRSKINVENDNNFDYYYNRSTIKSLESLSGAFLESVIIFYDTPNKELNLSEIIGSLEDNNKKIITPYINYCIDMIKNSTQCYETNYIKYYFNNKLYIALLKIEFDNLETNYFYEIRAKIYCIIYDRLIEIELICYSFIIVILIISFLICHICMFNNYNS